MCFLFSKFRTKESQKRKSPNNSEQSKAKRLVSCKVPNNMNLFACI